MLGVWQDLLGKNVKVEPLRDSRLGGLAFFLSDPEGNRLEFWSENRLSQEVVFSIPV